MYITGKISSLKVATFETTKVSCEEGVWRDPARIGVYCMCGGGLHIRLLGVTCSEDGMCPLWVTEPKTTVG